MVETVDIEAAAAAIEGLSAVARALGDEIDELRTQFVATAREGGAFAEDLRKGLNGAFRDVLIEGASLSDTLRNLARTMAEQGLNRALSPAIEAASNGIADWVGDLFQFAHGGVIEGGNRRAFASGGIVSGPVNFPMAHGIGLMGEAGPEAIMPLRRGADGKLGVAMEGGSAPINVTVNIQTPDIGGFQKSQAQIGAHMRRVIASSARGGV